MSDQDEVDRSIKNNISNSNGDTKMNSTSGNNNNNHNISDISKDSSGNNSGVKKKQWVKFEEDEDSSKNDGNTEIQLTNGKSHPLQTTPSNDTAPAVLTTESVHVTVDSRAAPSSLPTPQKPVTTTPAQTVIDVPTPPKNNTTPENPNIAGLRTIELSTGRVREGFANGDVIVTLLPVNTKLPWITPAEFRPELVPEELMAQGLTLTVEEYVHAMETLVNDYRFSLYNICYKRILVCWVFFAFGVLLALLFSGLMGITLFCLGIGWLFLNAVAIFFCMYLKLRLSRGLEKCLANVNKQLIKHKIILALDDRGKISCHKVNLCFIYFDPTQCITYLNNLIERHEQSGTKIEPGWEARMDISTSDIIIQGSNTTRVSRKQERAPLLYLRYASRWGNELARGIIKVSVLEPGRHCRTFFCPCQFIENHLDCKPRDAKTLYYVIYYLCGAIALLLFWRGVIIITGPCSWLILTSTDPGLMYYY